MIRILFCLAALTAAIPSAGAQPSRTPPGLPEIDAIDTLDIEAAQRALDSVAAGYHRQGVGISTMVHGTLLRFYDRDQVLCGPGGDKITVRDCLTGVWPDLSNYENYYLPITPERPHKTSGFTPDEVSEIQSLYFDALKRLNGLLIAVRYESELQPDLRYGPYVERLAARLAFLEEEARRAARFKRNLTIYGGTGGAAAFVVGFGFFFMRRALAAQRARMAAAQEDDEYEL